MNNPYAFPQNYISRDRHGLVLPLCCSDFSEVRDRKSDYQSDYRRYLRASRFRYRATPVLRQGPGSKSTPPTPVARSFFAALRLEAEDFSVSRRDQSVGERQVAVDRPGQKRTQPCQELYDIAAGPVRLRTNSADLLPAFGQSLGYLRRVV